MKLPITLLLALTPLAHALAADLQPFKFAEDERPAGCKVDGLKLPADFVVLAAGAYSGKVTNLQIDSSGHQATQFDIAVNSPSKPVVLLLGAYEPSVWNIGWTPGTKVLAVLATGYHRQAVAGLEPGVPRLVSSYDNKGACGYQYVSSGTLAGLNPLSRRVFNRPVDTVYFAVNGKAVVGAPLPAGVGLLTSPVTPPSSFAQKGTPLAGQAGLDAAVSAGLIRKATAADVNAWRAALAKAEAARRPAADLPRVANQAPSAPVQYVGDTYKAYVVLKQFAYPAGLYGGNLATFYIPKGVPRPTGNAGHSDIHEFGAPLSCSGPLCQARRN